MYTITDNSVLKDDGTCIPLDPGNADFQAFLAWQIAGNTPTVFNPFPGLKASVIANFILSREDMIGKLIGIAVAAQSASLPNIVTAALAARTSLLNLLNQPSVTSAQDIKSLRAAVTNEYQAILAAMPPGLKAAFNQLDQ